MVLSVRLDISLFLCVNIYIGWCNYESNNKILHVSDCRYVKNLRYGCPFERDLSYVRKLVTIFTFPSTIFGAVLISNSWSQGFRINSDPSDAVSLAKPRIL